jgi:hypothetical protein
VTFCLRLQPGDPFPNPFLVLGSIVVTGARCCFSCPVLGATTSLGASFTNLLSICFLPKTPEILQNKISNKNSCQISKVGIKKLKKSILNYYLCLPQKVKGKILETYR